MIDLFGSAPPGVRAALGVGLDVALKATALMTLVLLVHATLGRRRALVRSALWNASLVGLLLLPAASLAFPRLRITLPPARETATPQVPPRDEVGSAGAPVVEDPFPVPDLPAPAVVHRVEESSPQPAVPAPAARPGPRLDGGQVVLGAYAGVWALLALRLVSSLLAVGRLRRRCEPVVQPDWAEALERWRARLGISRRIALLASNEVSIPMVVGWLRPTVVVPWPLVETASAGLIDAVLAHELAHIRRGDFGWNLWLKGVQTLYWPHPLVWPLGRLVGAVREQACDDLCVHVLGGGLVYRASLLEVASGLVRRPGPSLGLAMARPSSLGRRLAWIDRSLGVPRCLLRWPARWALAATVAASAGVLGSIELARATVRAAEAPKGEDDAPPKGIEITVLAKDTGKPLVGATVRHSVDFTEAIRKTDRNGQALIELPQGTLQETFSFDVWADGYVQQRHFFAQHDARYSTIPARFTVNLLPGEETLGGKVTDEAGRPIAGAKVEVWGYLGEKKEPHELAYMVDATTDERGEWRCRDFRAMKFAYLCLSHPDYLPDHGNHARRHGSPSPTDPPGEGEQPLRALRDFSDVQVMTRGVEVVGQVVDSQDRPVAGAEVGWFESDGRDRFFPDAVTTSSEGEGRFRFPHARPGRLVLQVKARGHAPELKQIEAKAGMDPITLKLDRPRTLTGRVVDTKSAPIANAAVVVDTWRGYRTLGVLLRTDADGRFRWEDAPADSVLLNASRAGYQHATQRRASPEDQHVLITLRRALSLSGRIRDALTGKPVERADVEVGVVDPKSGANSWEKTHGVVALQGYLQGSLDAEEGKTYRLRIKAMGYAPFESRSFRSDEGQVEYDVSLTKSDKSEGAVVSGVVRRPDGRPLEGAEVALTFPLDGGTRMPVVLIEGGKIRTGRAVTVVKTGARGQFTLSREPAPAGQYFAVVVAHPEFYAEVSRSAWEANSTITAQPWGRVEGVARIGHKPAAGAEISHLADRLGNPGVPYIYNSGKTTADSGGRFVLERVVPGDVRVSRKLATGSGTDGWSNGTLIEVRSGETVHAEIGGRGRTVVAKITPPAGFDPKADYSAYSHFEVESDRPPIPHPKEVLASRNGSRTVWSNRWWASAEGHDYRRKWVRIGRTKLQPDGTVRVPDVPPGDYRLRLMYSAEDVARLFKVSPERIAYATRQFSIPEGDVDEPFDLGVLRPKPRETLKVGQAAPAFAVETLDGKRLKLEDFRGKYLLLDFWATWCGPCVAEMPELKAVYERFGKDERFALLSLSLDADKDAPRKFVAEKALPWAQGFLGDWAEGGVQEAYHVESIPTLFLIGPDGKLVSPPLRGEAVGAAVERALKGP